MEGVDLDGGIEASIRRVSIISILENDVTKLAGRDVLVGGWVKTGREQGRGSFAFLELNDGSCGANLQVVIDASVYPLAKLVPTGTSVLVEGELKPPPEGVKQRIELKVKRVVEVGPVDAGYPLPKTHLPLENLREISHLRCRTNVISAVARIRNQLAYATHTFFQQNGFQYVHTPIITSSDCEGAGEMFQVTTLFSQSERTNRELKENPPPTESDIDAAKLAVKEKGQIVAQLKTTGCVC